MPIIAPVAGISIGMMSDEKNYVLLTDIIGLEDFSGDMDFKVTGTKEGICGVQMDIKVDGLSMDIMREALAQAKRGRMHILDAMYQCLPQHREDVKPHAPRMEKLFIDKEFIGAVIGPQGKIIQEIQRETGTTINLEEKNNMGEISIFGTKKEGVDKAVTWIKGITAVPSVGDVYEAVVKSIMPFGAFVEFMPGKQGLVHISEVSWKRLETLEGLVHEGDVMKVKLIGTRSNRSAIGARVVARYAGKVQAQEVLSQSSFYSSSDSRLHFGLGASTSAELEVLWPSGTKESYSTACDQLVTIQEGKGILPSKGFPRRS